MKTTTSLLAAAAAVLGLTPNTFAARLSRARARLRAQLAPTATGELS